MSSHATLKRILFPSSSLEPPVTEYTAARPRKVARTAVLRPSSSSAQAAGPSGTTHSPNRASPAASKATTSAKTSKPRGIAPSSLETDENQPPTAGPSSLSFRNVKQVPWKAPPASTSNIPGGPARQTTLTTHRITKGRKSAEQKREDKLFDALNWREVDVPTPPPRPLLPTLLPPPSPPPKPATPTLTKAQQRAKEQKARDKATKEAKERAKTGGGLRGWLVGGAAGANAGTSARPKGGK